MSCSLLARLMTCGLAVMCVGVAPAVVRAQISADEAAQIAVDAYVYGYPLVTMEYTRRVMTNVAAPEGTRAPMGQLIKMRTYPNASFRDVTAPNADTLYTSAWLDLAKEPWILSLPDAHDRYYLMPMLDAWTEVFQVPGKRTTGTGPQKYALTAPGWKGTLPAGVTEYKSPTSLVWLLGRIYCTGTPEDYAAVHKMQDEISLVPLSAYGKPPAPQPAGHVDPSIDMKTAVREQVNALSGEEFFAVMADLLKANPPTAADAPMVAKLAKIGVVPGDAFDASKLDATVGAAIEAAPKAGLERIVAHFAKAGKDENAWIFPVPGGQYGVDYDQRATICYYGLGCNRTKDAVYPTSETDAEGQPYDGSKKYVMTFPKGELPPVEGFWSLTMYDADYFFVDNPLNRYTLSARNTLTPNADGSVSMYIQNENPGPEKEANWLPAPKGKFVLMLRMYWPRETPPSIIDGTWTVPPVKQAD